MRCAAWSGSLAAFVAAAAFVVTAQGGRIHAGKAKLGDGKKLGAADLVASGALQAGQILGS